MEDVTTLPERVAEQAAQFDPHLAERDLVLAASGGADSSAMVALLVEAGLADGARCTVAHFDHRLRGEDASARDRAAVAALCARYGLRLVEGAWDAPVPGEAAARRGRYAFLLDVASERGADVVTGHTADDQVETVVMHAMRGSGLHGLAGMGSESSWPFLHHGPGAGPSLLRPLLGVTRAEMRAYCAWRGLAFADDSSNDDAAFLRNRVRAGLHGSPSEFRDRVLALAETSRRLASELDRVAAPVVDAGSSEEGEVWLSRDDLCRLPAVAVPHAYRMAVVRLLGDARDFGRKHYDVMARAADGRTGARYELPRGVVLTVDAGAVVLSLGAPGAPAVEAHAVLALPGAATLGGWSVRVMPGASAGEGETVGLPEGVVLRGRRPGDVVRPAGMAGRKKLQDYYVDRKVPRRERDAAPVIALGGEVFWTPFGPAQAGASGRPFTVRAQRAGACRALTS